MQPFCGLCRWWVASMAAIAAEQTDRKRHAVTRGLRRRYNYCDGD
jgi:hypothetical protein